MEEFGRLLGTGKEAEVFEWGDCVLKLYKAGAPKRSPFREAAILAMVENLDLPAPVVLGIEQVGQRWGVVMTRANGPSFAERIADEPGAVIAEMVRLQTLIHSRDGDQFASLKSRLATNIGRAAGLDEARRGEMLHRLAALPHGNRLCHGDFHPWNILGRPGETMVVDWLDACQGSPAADVCRSYVLMRPVAPALAATYVEAYAETTGEKREAILGWLPVVAAARLAEGVPHEVAGLLAMVEGH
jgi:aminoglycoside phosphotransferase (APT) family kinase protein